MGDYIDEINRINVVERLIRREQVNTDRQNPFFKTILRMNLLINIGWIRSVYWQY